MTDPFGLLGLPRRPWLDPDALKERFHRLTAEHHPDVKGGDHAKFAEVNAAYTTLLDPALRLPCLLVLEGLEVGGDVQIPEDLGRLFMNTAFVRQQCETFLKKEEGTRSPIAKSTLAAEKLKVMDAVRAQIAVLNESRNSLLEQVVEIDRTWPIEAERNAPRLAKIAHSLTFFRKWISQLQEGYARLAV